MHDISQNNKKLLEDALTKYGIDAPEKYNFDYENVAQWGTIDRLWVKELGTGFIFGNFDKEFSDCVFLDNEPLAEVSQKARQEIFDEAIIDVESRLKFEERKTSEEASSIWENSVKADITHPYLEKHQIKGFGCRQQEDKLVFPLYDITTNICNLLYIDEDGNKQFLGSKKRGCYIPIGNPHSNKKIFVCDNYVTGAKIHEKTGEAVVIAFDPENFKPVKEALLSKYPNYEINIVSDTDLKEIAPSAGTNEAIDVFDQYSTGICTSKSENSQEKCDSDNLTEQETTEPAKEEVEPKTNTTEIKQNIPSGYILNDSGLYIKPNNTDDLSIKISDKIEVLAEARDTESTNWGKVIRFKDHDNNTKTLFIDNTKFITSGELEEILCYNGLFIYKPKELKKYLNDYETKNRALCVDKIGWCKESFVFPDGSIIGKNNENIIYYGSNSSKEFNTNGTLEDWQENISKYCQGNSRLILAVGAAFAGTLLNITGQENGGFHFVGNSTIGKSTILNVACSVYGDKEFMKTWRATDNGLEGVASSRNDNLLVLDELGQVDPNKAGEIAYMLGNGNGKIRSHKNGSTKKSYTWRLLYLSSGEIDLSDCATEAKKTLKAGQEVRLLNIPAQPSEDSFGAFETVHDKETGKAFSEYLNEVVRNYYGTAAREFIHCVVNDGFEKIANDFRIFLNNAEQKYLPAEADNQVKRAMNRFMLAAFAGEYATDHGITGWSKNDSLNACVKCFNAWIQKRGGTEDFEPKALLEQVRHFFEEHHNSRFIYINACISSTTKTYNAVGFAKKENDDSYKYYVFSQSFKEICGNSNLEFAKNTLFNAGWIEDKEPKQIGIRNDMLRGKRFYIFTSKIWDDEIVE